MIQCKIQVGSWRRNKIKTKETQCLNIKTRLKIKEI